MKLKNNLLLFVLVALFGACSTNDVKYVRQDVQGEFSIDVPDYLYEVNLDNPDASLQLGHEMKEHYMMAFMESHESLAEAGVEMDLESYTDFALNSLKSTLSEPIIEKSTVIPAVINGLNVSSHKIRGYFLQERLDVFYYLTIYRSERSFYYMTTWTLGRNEAAFSPIMEKSIVSFKEL